MRRALALACATAVSVTALAGVPLPGLAVPGAQADPGTGEASLRADADGPLRIRREAGVVTSVGAPAGTGIDNPAVGRSTPVPDAARAHLRRYGAAIGADRAGTRLVAEGAPRALGRGDVVRYQQQVDGVPVLGGEVVVGLGADREPAVDQRPPHRRDRPPGRHGDRGPRQGRRRGPRAQERPRRSRRGRPGPVGPRRRRRGAGPGAGRARSVALRGACRRRRTPHGARRRPQWGRAAGRGPGPGDRPDRLRPEQRACRRRALHLRRRAHGDLGSLLRPRCRGRLRQRQGRLRLLPADRLPGPHHGDRRSHGRRPQGSPPPCGSACPSAGRPARGPTPSGTATRCSTARATPAPTTSWATR
ncbi:hypothetical protein G5V59_03180 [Nocardioides sp. W3-2-3]|nr:hypothetical protein [Nocardioides convexus]